MLRISIIIPVVEEQRCINAQISHLRTLEPNLEIIVVDGRKDRSTLKVINDERVIRLHSELGRGNQMNLGAEHATGEVILFLHADVRLPKNGLGLIRESLEDENLVGGAFSLGVDSKNPLLRLIVGLTTIRSQLTRYPFGDQAIFLREKYFHEIHGFQEIPIMEDYELMRRIRSHHGHIRIFSEKVIASSRRWNDEGILASTARNWWLRMLYRAGVNPKILARFYPPVR